MYWAIFIYSLVVIHLESFAEPFRTSYYSSLTICVYYKHTARFPLPPSMLFHFRTSRMQVLVDYSTSFYCRSLAPTVEWDSLWAHMMKNGKILPSPFSDTFSLLFSPHDGCTVEKCIQKFFVIKYSYQRHVCNVRTRWEGSSRLNDEIWYFQLKILSLENLIIAVWNDEKGIVRIVGWFHYRLLSHFYNKMKNRFSEHFRDVSRRGN